MLVLFSALTKGHCPTKVKVEGQTKEQALGTKEAGIPVLAGQSFPSLPSCSQNLPVFAFCTLEV